MARRGAILVTGLREFISRTEALRQQSSFSGPVTDAMTRVADRFRDDASRTVTRSIDRPDPRMRDPFVTSTARIGKDITVEVSAPGFAGELLERMQEGEGPPSGRALYIIPSEQNPYGDLPEGGVQGLLRKGSRFMVEQGDPRGLPPGVWERKRTAKGERLMPVALFLRGRTWRRTLDLTRDIDRAEAAFPRAVVKAVDGIIRKV